MDQYDQHIAHLLTLTPAQVEDEWNNWRGIFKSTGNGPSYCGCLTTVRRNEGWGSNAETLSLTQRIRADERIPLRPCDITPEHYPIFAEWHRIIDAELGRN